MARIPHLNRDYHFTELMRDTDIVCSLDRFESNFDHSMLSLLILKPTSKKNKRLFFFFHGMDGDCGDVVVVRDLVKKFDAMVVCISGRGSSWVSDAFLADAEMIISNYSKSFSVYYLIGISMGGTQALALAGLLTNTLKNKIKGVIALIPGVNLKKIVQESSNNRVSSTLLESVNGSTTKLDKRSPNNIISKYRKHLPIVIFYNKNDSIFPTKYILSYFKNLQCFGHPIYVFANNSDHDFTFRNFDYLKVINKLGETSLHGNDPPLLS